MARIDLEVQHVCGVCAHSELCKYKENMTRYSGSVDSFMSTVRKALHDIGASTGKESLSTGPLHLVVQCGMYKEKDATNKSE